jgi:hypothetical protein
VGRHVDGRQAYFGNGSYRSRTPGGVRRRARGTGQAGVERAAQPVLCAASRAATRRRPAPPRRSRRRARGSIDGGLRAYAADGGEHPLAVRHQPHVRDGERRAGTGASIDGSPLIVGGGMIFVNSGYGGIAARPGNVLLAFGVD